MKSALFDRLIIATFVTILGTLWFFTRHCETHSTHGIAIYDKLGSQITLDGLRTTFNTRAAAVSFARYYKETLPHYDFVLTPAYHRIKRKFL